MTRDPALTLYGARAAPAAWISTFGFGLYTVFISALTMLLPSYLDRTVRSGPRRHRIGRRLATLGALPATAAAMVWMRRGPPSARRSTISLLAAIPFALALYRCEGSGLAAHALLAVAAVVVSGLVPPITFAWLPRLAGAVGSDDPRVATANGLITQFGASGALVGPPLTGMIVRAWGWANLGIVESVLLVAMAIAIVLAESIAGGT